MAMADNANFLIDIDDVFINGVFIDKGVFIDEVFKDKITPWMYDCVIVKWDVI